MKKTLLFIFFLSLPFLGFGAVPNSFSNGQPADADKVNENFQALDSNVQTLNADVQSLQTDVTALQNTFSGKVINVTYHISNVRRILAIDSSIEMESFSVNKRSANSFLIIQGTLSGKVNEAGTLQQGWKYGDGIEVLGQSLMYSADVWTKVFNTQVVIQNHTTTGPQNLVFRYFDFNNQGGHRPFSAYNPNSTDDARLGQTQSVYVVWEIEPWVE